MGTAAPPRVVVEQEKENLHQDFGENPFGVRLVAWLFGVSTGASLGESSRNGTCSPKSGGKM